MMSLLRHKRTSSKKKILFVVEKIHGGGVERIAQIILRNFDYERYDVTLLTVPAQDLGELKSLPLKHISIFKKEKSSDKYVQNFLVKLHNKIRLLVYYKFSPGIFAKLFARIDCDVAIAFIEGYATRIVSGMGNNVRKLAWIHIDLNMHRWTTVAYRSHGEEIQAYKRFDHIACVSNRVTDVSSRILNISCNISTLYNPIETSVILEKSKAESQYYYRRKDSIKIISLGSLVERKGYKMLINAFSRLVRSGVNAELLILGEGPQSVILHDLIDSLSLNGIVHLPGYVENPYPYVLQSDIYVCSSDAEGYNTAISEALILGKPVVATDCCGVKEQLGENNEYGIRVEISEDGLYNGLLNMLSPGKIDEFTIAARKVASRYTLGKNMAEIYKLIEG